MEGLQERVLEEVMAELKRRIETSVAQIEWLEGQGSWRDFDSEMARCDALLECRELIVAVLKEEVE